MLASCGRMPKLTPFRKEVIWGSSTFNQDGPWRCKTLTVRDRSSLCFLAAGWQQDCLSGNAST